MAENVRVLISEEAVTQRIRSMAEQISRDYAGRTLHMIGVLKGSVFFMTELARQIRLPCSLDFLSVSSYGNGTVSSGELAIRKALDEPIEGKDVLVVEDIVDSGRTLAYLKQALSEKRPGSLRFCTLLDKPERRVVDIAADYTGFQVPDVFVVGYGMDYEQKYRNLPYIGVVEQ